MEAADHTTSHTPKSLRVRLDLTQQQVADRATELAKKSDPEASVSVQTVARLEDGKDVSLDSLRWLAPALEVTREALLTAIDVIQRRAEASRAKPAPRGRRAKGAA
jgi:transcriptional regulator with XRE-family HTH domain